MMLSVRKTGTAKKLISTRVSKGSEDPVQVFNGYGSLDWYMTWTWRALTFSQHKKGKNYKPILPP